MNRGKVSKTIHKCHKNLSPVLIEKALDIFFETIQTALIEKRRVEIRRFGIFSLCHRPARNARNPGTGETILVKERTYVHFKMGKQLQIKLNQTEPPRQ